MDTSPAAPSPFSAHPAVTWHHHDDRPTAPVKAIIVIHRGTTPIALAELYNWDDAQGHWISACTQLMIRQKEFLWAPIDALLQSSVPLPVAAATPRLWPRNEEATADLLALVGIVVPPVAIADWTDAQIEQAEDYAGAAHLRASDNDIEVPPLPAFLTGYEVQS